MYVILILIQIFYSSPRVLSYSSRENPGNEVDKSARNRSVDTDNTDIMFNC